MRLGTISENNKDVAVLVLNEGIYKISDVNRVFNKTAPTSVFEIINSGKINQLKEWCNKLDSNDISRLIEFRIPISKVNFEPLYRFPGKIWGIGLNYVEHASDLSEIAPSTEPASFMKPDTTIIGQKDTINIPFQSKRTTAEAELGIVIGEKCKNVSEEDVPNYIAGFTTVIDMTAEDILEKNPRYLTRAKSFDTFFSFGPILYTLDEIDEINDLNVSTIINGQLHRKNVVSNMTFRPWHLVSFHSEVMTLLPGDIISTGTPGATVIRDGDVVECHIDKFTPLVNSVVDLKK